MRTQIQAQLSVYRQSTLYSYREGVETTDRFLLSCPNYSDKRLTLLNEIRNIILNILENSGFHIAQFLLYGNNDLTASANFIFLNSTTEHIQAAKN